jgi:hypothetical protein
MGSMAPCPPRARKEGRARRLRVTHGQPTADLTCTVAGPQIVATTFASRGSRRRDAARRLMLDTGPEHIYRTQFQIVGSWRGTPSPPPTWRPGDVPRALVQSAWASRTRCTIASSSAQAVSGCSIAKGRKTHAGNTKYRNCVSAVTVAERAEWSISAISPK